MLASVCARVCVYLRFLRGTFERNACSELERGGAVAAALAPCFLCYQILKKSAGGFEKECLAPEECDDSHLGLNINGVLVSPVCASKLRVCWLVSVDGQIGTPCNTNNPRPRPNADVNPHTLPPFNPSTAWRCTSARVVSAARTWYGAAAGPTSGARVCERVLEANPLDDGASGSTRERAGHWLSPAAQW